MRLDPFLQKRTPDPDAVVKSVVAKYSEDQVRDERERFGEGGSPQQSPKTMAKYKSMPSARFDAFLTAPDAVGKSRPPMPRVIEVDQDQDSVAREMDSDDPTASYRPGCVTDEPALGAPLMADVGKRNKYRTHGGKYAEKAVAAVEKAWSDAAREAAAEARRANGARRAHEGLKARGWQHFQSAGDPRGQERPGGAITNSYMHTDHPGEHIHVNTDARYASVGKPTGSVTGVRIDAPAKKGLENFGDKKAPTFRPAGAKK